MLFFQAALLLGYLYTHVATSRLAPRTQVLAHLVLFVVPVAFLPLAVAAEPGAGSTLDTVLRLLAGLAVGVGAPFFLVSTSGPLLQRWFSWSSHARRHDPYFLYAASNIGSILGLLAYPLLVEPTLDVAAQARWWSAGYVLLGVLLVAASWWVRGAPRTAEDQQAGQPDEASDVVDVVPVVREGPRATATWVGLAFLPSSLMLGVTTFLSTDIAAVPLLWVLPLAVYLATFVVAFSRWSAPVARASRRVAAPITVLAAVSHLAGLLPLWATVALTIGSFGAIAMVIHDRLAARRPSAERLTAFYVWISVGGALGGVVNGVLAPVLLPGPFEFAIVGLVAAAVVGLALDELVGGTRSAAFWVAGLGVPVAVITLGVCDRAVRRPTRGVAGRHRGRGRGSRGDARGAEQAGGGQCGRPARRARCRALPQRGPDHAVLLRQLPGDDERRGASRPLQRLHAAWPAVPATCAAGRPLVVLPPGRAVGGLAPAVHAGRRPSASSGWAPDRWPRMAGRASSCGSTRSTRPSCAWPRSSSPSSTTAQRRRRSSSGMAA